MFLLEPAKARSIEKAAESPGIKRHAAYRHCNEGAAFDERWDAALNWQTELAEVADGVPRCPLTVRRIPGNGLFLIHLPLVGSCRASGG